MVVAPSRLVGNSECCPVNLSFLHITCDQQWPKHLSFDGLSVPKGSSEVRQAVINQRWLCVISPDL